MGASSRELSVINRGRGLVSSSEFRVIIERRRFSRCYKYRGYLFFSGKRDISHSPARWGFPFSSLEPCSLGWWEESPFYAPTGKLPVKNACLTVRLHASRGLSMEVSFKIRECQLRYFNTGPYFRGCSRVFRGYPVSALATLRSRALSRGQQLYSIKAVHLGRELLHLRYELLQWCWKGWNFNEHAHRHRLGPQQAGLNTLSRLRSAQIL